MSNKSLKADRAVRINRHRMAGHDGGLHSCRQSFCNTPVYRRHMRSDHPDVGSGRTSDVAFWSEDSKAAQGLV